jgi:hypothetical protein
LGCTLIPKPSLHQQVFLTAGRRHAAFFQPGIAGFHREIAAAAMHSATLALHRLFAPGEWVLESLNRP